MKLDVGPREAGAKAPTPSLVGGILLEERFPRPPGAAGDALRAFGGTAATAVVHILEAE